MTASFSAFLWPGRAPITGGHGSITEADAPLSGVHISLNLAALIGCNF